MGNLLLTGLRIAMVIVVIEIAVATPSPSPGSGPGLPSSLSGLSESQRVDQLYKATSVTLADAVTALSNLRAQLESGVVGQERWADFGHFANVSRADVDSLFEESLTQLTTDRSDLNTDYGAYKNRKINEEAFARGSYSRAEDAVKLAWKGELSQSSLSKGWFGVWQAPLWRMAYRHDDEMTQLQAQLANSDLSYDQKQAMIDALKAKQSAEDHGAFVQLVGKYRALLTSFQDFRKTWAGATWRWADFGLALAQTKDDVHDAYQQELRRLVLTEFAAATDRGFTTPNQDTTVEFFNDYPGSPDRLITPFSPIGVDKWCDANEFPDLAGDCVLRMKHLADVSVLDLRPPWPANWQSSQSFPGAPDWYTPGEVPPAQP